MVLVSAARILPEIIHNGLCCEGHYCTIQAMLSRQMQILSYRKPCNGNPNKKLQLFTLYE